MGDDWVRGIVARLHAMGMRAVGYVRPFVYADEYFNTQSEYDEVYAQGLGTRTAAGTQYLQPGIFGFPTLNLDFTNPATVTWWERRLRYMLDLGFDGFMQDFGEEISPDMHFFDGSTGQEMHNAYPTMFHKLSREIVDAYEREHPKRGQIFFYTRAGFSGRPGSAAFENSNFPGDETASWTTVGGLPTIFPDFLSRGIGGALGYNTDIGGYVDPGQGAPPVADNYDFGGPTDKELYLRWTQASAFLPFFRVHNNQRSGVKMPWSYDDEAKQAWVAMAKLHRRATPLIRRVWQDFPQTGIPPAAPLWLMAPGDERAAKETFAFMVGPDLLVAPVVEQGATMRSVYFPAGCWQHGETGERFEGGRSADVGAPVTSLPWFVRCGTNPLFAGERAELGLPPAGERGSCRSRRSFTIRLRHPRGDRLARARVFVDGKRVKVLKGRRLRARVDLRGLPRGRYAVRVEGVGRSGRRYVETRRYRTCGGPRTVSTPKRPRRTS
jgi:alpha-D-xyloside xylohydrolase